MSPAFRFVVALLAVVGLAWGTGAMQTADSADPPPAIERCDSLNPCNP